MAEIGLTGRERCHGLGRVYNWGRCGRKCDLELV